MFLFYSAIQTKYGKRKKCYQKHRNPNGWGMEQYSFRQWEVNIFSYTFWIKIMVVWLAKNNWWKPPLTCEQLHFRSSCSKVDCFPLISQFWRGRYRQNIFPSPSFLRLENLHATTACQSCRSVITLFWITECWGLTSGDFRVKAETDLREKGTRMNENRMMKMNENGMLVVEPALLL